jgi:hypothetical protein
VLPISIGNLNLAPIDRRRVLVGQIKVGAAIDGISQRLRELRLRNAPWMRGPQRKPPWLRELCGEGGGGNVVDLHNRPRRTPQSWEGKSEVMMQMYACGGGVGGTY